MDNTSNHLYRVNVKNREHTIQKLSSEGITTGIHYTPLHKQPLYMQEVSLPKSEEDGKTTLSIPFNEALSEEDVSKIVQEVKHVIV